MHYSPIVRVRTLRLSHLSKSSVFVGIRQVSPGVLSLHPWARELQLGLVFSLPSSISPPPTSLTTFSELLLAVGVSRSK